MKRSKSNQMDEKKFKAVDFMREVRQQLTEEYLKDKEKYFSDLKRVSENFRKKRVKQIAINS